MTAVGVLAGAQEQEDVLSQMNRAEIQTCLHFYLAFLLWSVLKQPAWKEVRPRQLQAVT